MRSVPVAGRLRSFRLADVPIELRVRAAERLVRTTALPDDPVDARDRLFARLLADQTVGADTGDADVLRQVARAPSDRVYWIRASAWEKVVG